MNILRRSCRILGSAFRVTKTLLRRIWINSQPKKELTYEEAVRTRNEAKLRLDYLLEVRKEREKIKEGWN